jgi:catecholate siderophore receptor
MPQHGYTFISRLFCVLILFCFSALSSAAEQRSAQPTFRFEIPAGELEAALTDFEKVAGVRVTLPDSTTVRGLSSPGVTATCTVTEALTALLAGSGLGFRPSGAKTFILEVAPVSENVEVRASAHNDMEVTTAGTRTLTPLREVPQAITVITRPMMAEQMMSGMADVVRYVPGVGMGQGEGNRDAPVLRGNSTTGDFFVDGVRDDVQYYRDTYNVDRVEVLKGPNAMIFGRGGAGGVINRTTRQADWSSAREITIQGGSHDNRRATIDVDQAFASGFAGRLTGLYENSESYRSGVRLERYGLNPTAALAARGAVVRLGYERFHDERTADRGVPSYDGRPFQTDPSTFFGDPAASTARVTVDAFSAAIDRPLGRVGFIRNRTRYAEYDKFYQNVYPSGAVHAEEQTVSLGAYNNATTRRNLFNQTDLTFAAQRWRISHTFLAGAELGRQVSDNFRNTGYFQGGGSLVGSIPVAIASPTIAAPVTFRQSPTDADNHGTATVTAVYAQDQVRLSSHFHAVAGVRYDRFDVQFRNNRTGATLSSVDHLVSPRFGFIYSPAASVSLYTSYSLAHVPRAGDQLSSLSFTNQSLEPEKFTNYEVGAKWDLQRGLSVTTAVYRLDRTNVAVPDPTDTTRLMLIDGQRMKGVEIGIAGQVTGRWRVLGAYAYQDSRITRTLAPNAREGARLAQVPSHSFALWNRYDFSRHVGVGLGAVREGAKFTATDNTVVLPAFTRMDVALFATVTSRLRAQLNIENLLNGQYYPSSNGNNNIAPGAPRFARLSLTTRF